MNMDSEIISKIELLDTGELLLGLEGQGKTEYQYIYREAKGVYWDQNLRGFKSTELKRWSCSQWFSHIVCTVEDGLGIELQLSKDISWKNVPISDQDKIVQCHTT